VEGREVYGLGYFFRSWYFGYGFKAFKAIIKLYDGYFKLIERLTGLSLLNGRGKRALDVGCALGVTTKWLASLGYEVIGLDISEAIKLAKKAYWCLEFVRADAQFLPLAPSSIDLVVAFEVFEHLPSPTLFVLNLWTVLKPKGVAIITSPSRSLTTLVSDTVRGEKTHINLPRPEEALKIFRKVFSDVFVVTRLFLPIPPNILRRYFVLYNIPRALADGYILVGWNKKRAKE
jgi:2-polyprenyl-3-methyl-5-hydroxy-6-metoxy-1,4-benzoquinol methylase